MRPAGQHGVGGRGERSDSKPWYRQFWPWFLIALPLSSVVMSFATLYVAIDGADEVLPHEGDSTSYSAPDAVSPLDEKTASPAPAADGPASLAGKRP